MMNFANLTPEQQETLKAAKTPEELAKLAEEAGIELSDEMLESVSGGIYSCRYYAPCPNAVDTSGRPCKTYRFM